MHYVDRITVAFGGGGRLDCCNGRLHQHSIGYPEDSFTGQKTTNSIKVLKEKLASHRPEESQNPRGASRKEKPYHSESGLARQRLACTSTV